LALIYSQTSNPARKTKPRTTPRETLKSPFTKTKMDYEKQATLEKHNKANQRQGFTITELIIASAIMSILSAIAIPNYIAQLCRSESSEAHTTVSSINTIITAFVDETSELSTT
jgi:prepilin-type N-terminal cleavage/methylation domain-containing protein